MYPTILDKMQEVAVTYPKQSMNIQDIFNNTSVMDKTLKFLKVHGTLAGEYKAEKSKL